MRTIRRIWWPVMSLLFLAFVFGVSVKTMQVIAFLAFVGMVAWWFMGTFISRIVGAMLVSSIRCPGCGLQMPAVDRWQIGSYTDHRERHFLFAKNPIDGVRIGHVNCPKCSASIIL